MASLRLHIEKRSEHPNLLSDDFLFSNDLDIMYKHSFYNEQNYVKRLPKVWRFICVINVTFMTLHN